MGRGKRGLRCRRRDRWLSEAKPDEVFFRADMYFLLFQAPANLRICRVIYLSFYSFRNSAFFSCEKKAPKKHTKAGREKSPRLAIHPSARRRLFLSSIRGRAGCRSARAPNEMFRSGKLGSVSDEARGKRFFALRPQNDKRRKRISQSVILSVSEESFHSAQIRTSGES